MIKYTHFTEKDREELFVLLKQGINNKDIAEILLKDPSSVGREIKRNKIMIGIRNNNNPKAKVNSSNYTYLPDKAHKKYLERRKESKQLCPLKTIDLLKYVPEKLKEGLSPGIISGRAKLEGIGNISHECIYQFIYSRMGMKMKLFQYLPRSHKRRRKKSGRKEKRTLIPNRLGIELRPIEIEDRKEFGHWEADSIVGIGKRSALNTNRERLSRKIIIEKINRKTALNTRLAIVKRFESLPLKARLTNTADNGCEFTEHEKITETINMKFYFADPYASWQRGTNENGNGLVRRFFPKKTNFDQITDQQIKAVEDWINNRPMKCLGYRTPNEVFNDELKKLKSLPMKN